MRPLFLLSSLALLFGSSAEFIATHRLHVPAPCPWCGVNAALPSASARIAPPGEPGQPLEVNGTVYRADGRTPAANVYLVATQAASGPTSRPHMLRGAVRSDVRGHYRFVTVRPAAARDRGEPAQIEMTAVPEGGREQRINPVEFEDDSLLTPALRAFRPKAGGSGIVRPSTDSRGVTHVVRDIVLERE